MKKVQCVVLLIGLMSQAYAQLAPVEIQTIGYNDAGSITTAARAKNMRDDAWVTLKGKITSRISEERYQFRDSSGSIVLDIDDDYMRGMTLGPNDTVMIQGEIDKDWNKNEVDVKSIQVIR